MASECPDRDTIFCTAIAIALAEDRAVYIAQACGSDHELRGQVQAALGRLREQDRDLLVMRYLEQLGNREIAAVFGISEGAVKMRHLRALPGRRGRLTGAVPPLPREGRQGERLVQLLDQEGLSPRPERGRASWTR